MKRFTAALIAAAALFAAIPAAAQTAAQTTSQPAAPTQAQNCAKPQGVFLTLEATPKGYVLPVTVNGAVHKFLLDFAQPYSIIDESIAKVMNLDTKPMPKTLPTFFAAQMLSNYVTVPSLEFGGMRFPPTEFVVWKKGQRPPMTSVPEEELMLGVDGVIGMNALTRIDFDLDLKDSKLGLIAPYHCPFIPDWHTGAVGSVPFEFTPLRIILLSATLDGKPIHVAINTSMKENSMTARQANKQLGINSSTAGLTDLPRLLGTPRHQIRFKNLEMSGLNIGNPEVVIFGRLGTTCENSQSPSFDMQSCMVPAVSDLSLGTDTLSKLHLYFAVESKTLYFGAATAPAAAPVATPAPTVPKP
jgi:hypothetical protein